MNYNHFTFLILALASSAHSSITRYITELEIPSNQHHADQSHVPAAPARPSYIYQVDDPVANYVYSDDYLTKKDIVPYKKRPNSNTWTWTPTGGPNSRFVYTSNAIPTSDMVQVTHTPPVINRYCSAAPTPLWYPSNYDYAGSVYTTPYEFSDTASTFVQPNVLYSTYSTNSRPVYVVNNAFNGYNIPYIYENPKQYVYSELYQPVGYHYDATEIPNYSHTDNVNKKKPPKIQNKPNETNLTKINIDPITQARFAEILQQQRAALRTSETSKTSYIIHKQRPNYHITYGVMYHMANYDQQQGSPSPVK